MEYFAECRHIGRIQSMLFNVAPGRHYQPYTLIEVPDDKVSLLEMLLLPRSLFFVSVGLSLFWIN